MINRFPVESTAMLVIIGQLASPQSFGLVFKLKEANGNLTYMPCVGLGTVVNVI